MSRQIEMEWPELKTKVVATLADDKNPKLCDVLWKNLPIESIQSHAGCSGQMMYAFHNIVDFTKPEHVEDHTAPKYWGKVPWPVGVIRFDAQGFQNIMVMWGKRTEPGKLAAVGFVREADLGKLGEVGEKVLEGMFTGQYYKVVIRKKD